jgi:hypothetical protein
LLLLPLLVLLLYLTTEVLKFNIAILTT